MGGARALVKIQNTYKSPASSRYRWCKTVKDMKEYIVTSVFPLSESDLESDIITVRTIPLDSNHVTF